MISFVKEIKKKFQIDPDSEKEKTLDQTMTNWINQYLHKKNMSINKVEDLLDELKWKTLFEILWGKHIEYEIDTKLSKKRN